MGDRIRSHKYQLSCNNGLNIARLNLIEINIKGCAFLASANQSHISPSSLKSTTPFPSGTVNTLENAVPYNLRGPSLAPSCPRSQLIHSLALSVTSSPERLLHSLALAEHLPFGADCGLPFATVILFPPL